MKNLCCMKSAPGRQLLFDGWTFNGQHFVGVFASYTIGIWYFKALVDRQWIIKKVHEIRLIGCGPPPPIEQPDDASRTRRIARFLNEDEEAIKFYKLRFALCFFHLPLSDLWSSLCYVGPLPLC